MATTVASRFAVLCDDAEDVFQHSGKRNAAKKPENMKESAAVASVPKMAPKNKKKKNKENVQVRFGSNNSIFKLDPQTGADCKAEAEKRTEQEQRSVTRAVGRMAGEGQRNGRWLLQGRSNASYSSFQVRLRREERLL